MYPAQTSFIPIQIALARFLEENLGNFGGLGIFGGSGNYPYWYLGTTPFRYLTGPILPGLLVVSRRFFPSLDLFEVFWGWLGAFWVMGGLGVYWLVRELGKKGKMVEREKKVMAVLAAVFYLFGPIAPFLFRFSDGLSLMAFSVLPWVYAKYAKFLSDSSTSEESHSTSLRTTIRGVFLARSWKTDKALLALMVLVMLLDISVIPSMFLGMVAIFLAVSGWKRAEEKIKDSFKLLAFSFLLATLWYTPGYWWQLLIAPSFAGKPLFRVISLLGQLLPIALAIGLAIVSSKTIKLKKSSIIHYQSSIKFCFYWLFIFGFLTLVRFISDPDFWLDWSAYGTELQMGVGVLEAFWVVKLIKNENLKMKNYKAKLKIFTFLLVVFTFYFCLFTFVFNKYILGTLQKDIAQTVEYRIGKWLDGRVKKEERGETVFLSGTTAFWLNAFFDIPQVRGGADLVSVHPAWRKTAWEIREGATAKAAEEWLKTLNISYLVVHTQDSAEFWHDFENPEKFEKVEGLEKVYDERGDRIYRVL